MKVLQNLSKRTFFTVLFSVCAVATLLCGLNAMRSVAATKVGGPLYNQLIDANGLATATSSSAEFTADAYAKTLQMLRTNDVAEREALATAVASLKTNYLASHEKWQGHRNAQLAAEAAPVLERESLNAIYDALLVNVHKPATQFFELFESKFLPALRAGNSELANSVAATELKSAVESQRREIQELSNSIAQYDKAIRGVASSKSSKLSMSFLALFAIVAGSFGGLCVLVQRLIKSSDHVQRELRLQLNAVDKSQATIEFKLDGTIVTANDNFLKTLGYSLPEIVGKHHSMFVESSYVGSPEYAQFWADLKTGTFKAAEYKRIAKGGREVWIQATYCPVFDAAGQVCRVVKYAIDVTETKLKSADFQGQLNAIDKAQAIIEFNMDGSIRSANTNFLNTLGYTLDEIKGKHHSMFVESSYANSHEYRVFWDDLRAGKFQAAQYKRIGKNGKEVWIQASYNPIFDLNGRPYKVVKYATDISAAKRMEFEIAETQKRDAQQAIETQARVSEILAVAEKVAVRDYSQKLSIQGQDAIGRLGEGLTKFFADKQVTEMREQQRADEERRQADELQRKVAIMLEVVNAVADGRFDVDIPDLGTDAIGQVSSALQQAVNSMKQALTEVRDVSGTVSTAAEQLNQVAREITAGAQTQASSLEETASSLEEITSTVKQNSDNAQQARQLANGSRDIAEKGGSVVSEAVQAMGEINQSSKKIADIITTIDEIAFQTNLLALNAAVEAARAGEQGRGFAVVAAEVRNLAQRSASAAKEIKSLIQDSVRKVETGTDLVNRSGQTLGDIVNSVKRVTDIVSEIAAASKEQLTGIEQVNKAVSQMDRVTQGNASQTEEMSGTASSLLSHAVQLGALVSRFRLERAGQEQSTSASNHDAPAARRNSPSPARNTPAPIATFDSRFVESGVLEF